MTDRETTDPRFVESPQEVEPFTVRMGREGTFYGPLDVDAPLTAAHRGELLTGNLNLNDIYSGPLRPSTNYDDFVLTPDEFRSGYRLRPNQGPPLSITLTEGLAQDVADTIDYIDEFMPRTASLLANRPHLLFTMPEIQASINDAFMDMTGMESAMAVAPIIEAMAEAGDNVFNAPSLEEVLATTPGTSTFWHDWGDFFSPDEQDIVATLLAITPVDKRDRVAGNAYRTMQQNREQLSRNPEKMNEFLYGLYKEVKNQQEEAERQNGGFFGFLHNLSKPYYAVSDFVAEQYTNIVAPEDVAWRSALTPGQTIAISLGLDPSDAGWNWTSGTIDFIGNFVLDPINVAAGIGLGAKSARAFPIAAEAAAKARGLRIIETSVPLVGRKLTPNLPIGTRSTWQRIGYHLFAKDADKLVESVRLRPVYKKIAEHWAARPNDFAGLVEKFPELRPLLGPGGGALEQIRSTDPDVIKEGFRILLQQNAANRIDTVKGAQDALTNIRDRLKKFVDEVADRGVIGLDDLDATEYVAAKGVYIPENPHPQPRHMLMRQASPSDADSAVMVWRTAPRELVLAEPDVKFWMEYIGIGSRDADEVLDAVREPRQLSIFTEEVDGVRQFVIESRFGEGIAQELQEVVVDARQVREGQQLSLFDSFDYGQAGPRSRFVATGRDDALRQIGAGGAEGQTFTRRVRILIDEDAGIHSLPEDIAGPLRLAIQGSLPEDLPPEEAIAAVDKIVRASMRSGTETLEEVAKVNEAAGLRPLYTGLGASFSAEIKVPRVGKKIEEATGIGGTWKGTDRVRMAMAGEPSLNITDSYPFFFPESIWSTTDASLAGSVNDLGRIDESWKQPVEFVIWNRGKGTRPNIVDLNKSNPVTELAIREQLKYLRTPRDSEIFEEVDGWDSFVRKYLEGDMASGILTDEQLAKFDRFAAEQRAALMRRLGVDELTPEEEELVLTRAQAMLVNEGFEERMGAHLEEHAFDEYLALKRRVTGKDPEPHEIEAFKETFLMKYSEEARQLALEPKLTLLGMQDEGLAYAMELTFDSAAKAIADVTGVTDYAALSRQDRMKVTSAMLLQSDIDEIEKLEGISDLQRLYHLRQAMETAGMPGERINNMMRQIERLISEPNEEMRGALSSMGLPTHYDAVKLGHGPKKPIGALGMVEKRKELQRLYRNSVAKIDAEFGVRRDPTARRPVPRNQVVFDGDIFDGSGIPVIPTNQGGVHGAGIANDAEKKGLIKRGQGRYMASKSRVALPVKKNWKDQADPKLIERGLRNLARTAKKNPDQIYLLPPIGLGHGGLDAEDIQDIVHQILIDNPNIRFVMPSADAIKGQRQGVLASKSKRGAATRLVNYLLGRPAQPEEKLAAATVAGGPQIISGGQTGVDRWALEEARDIGFKTGGTAPPGFATAAAEDESEILRGFGLLEGAPDPKTYPKRTMRNVDDADMTVAFLAEESVGTRYTIGYAQTGHWTDMKDGELVRDLSNIELELPIWDSPLYSHRPVKVVIIEELRELDDDQLETVGRVLGKRMAEAEGTNTINLAGPRAKSLQSGDEERIRKVMRAAMDETRGIAEERAAATGRVGEVAGEAAGYTEDLSESKTVFSTSHLSDAKLEAYNARQKLATDRYQKAVQELRGSTEAEHEIIAWLPKKSKKGRQYHKVRTGYDKTEMRLEFAVPSNQKTRDLMNRMYGNEVFLGLPAEFRDKIVANMQRSPRFGLGVGPEGSLDIPHQPFLSILDEDAPEDVRFLAQADEVGWDQLRPPELPRQADVEDPLLQERTNLSLDFQLPGEEGGTLGDLMAGDPGDRFVEGIDITEPGTGAVDIRNKPGRGRPIAPSLLPPTEEAPSLPTPFAQRYPTFTQDDLDVIKAMGDAHGYDSVVLPGGWQILTDQGQSKAQVVRRGSGHDPKAVAELKNLRTQLVEAETALARAKAAQEHKVYALKQMPVKESHRLISQIGKLTGGTADMDTKALRMARRLRSGFTDPAYPEGIQLTDTAAGYGQLRTFLRHLGVKPTSQSDYLNRFVTAPVAQRHGVLSEILTEVAEEIDHPFLRSGLKEFAAGGGISSYAPYVDGAGNTVDRGLRGSRSRPGQARPTPGLPSHLSVVYPLPTPDFYKMLTRYRKGQVLRPWVHMASTLGGTKTRRIKSGERILNRLKQVDPEAFGSMGMEEALLLGYANISDPETLSAFQKGLRTLGGAWTWAHRKFTRVQLAGRPFTWPLRVIFFDESVRGALFDMPSLYRSPFAWMTGIRDSYRTAQRNSYRIEFGKLMNRELGALFMGSNTIDDAVSRAHQIVPTFAATAERLGLVSADGFDNISQIRRALHEMITLDQEGLSLPVSWENFGRRLRTARRKALRGEKTLAKYHLPEEWSPDELTDMIGQKGLVAAVTRRAEATYAPIEYRPGIMSARERRAYATAWAEQLNTFVTDPWGKVAIRELQAQLSGGSTGAATKILSSKNWEYLRDEIKAMADFAGLKMATERELAQWHVDNYLLPLARDLMSSLWPDPEAMREGLSTLARGRTVANVGGNTYDLRFAKSKPGALEDTVRRMVDQNPNHNFPARVAAHFDARRILEDAPDLTISGGKVLPYEHRYIMKAADKIIETSGETLTQVLNRRGAWMSAYRKEMEYMLSRGFDESVARVIASQEATRRVNHIYFNMKDVPLYIGKANRVIPFFSAMYEVTTSWAYKVPLAQSALGWPGGASVLGRKVDRFFHALVSAGLLTVEEPDEDSPWGTRQVALRISDDLGSNNELANLASKGLRAMMKGPEQVVRWLSLIGKNTSGPSEDPFDSVDYTLGVGNPIDVFSHGFGAALQLSAGVNPAGSLLLGEVRRRTPWAGDNERAEAVTGDTLADIAAANGVTVRELVNTNADLLRKTGAFDRLEINEFMRGVTDISNQPLKADVSLRVPGSSVIGEMLDQVFFPFDQVESGVGVINGYVPSWANFFFRGWGLHNAIGEDVPWTLGADGEIIFTNQGEDVSSDIANMFVNYALPPETRTYMAGEITTALQYLEATEGVLTSHFENVEEYNNLLEEYVAQGLQVVTTEDGPEFKYGEHPAMREAAEQLEALYEEIENHNAMIVQRATNIASFGGMVRGLAGFLGPGNPRLVWEDMEKRSIYYDSQDAITDATITKGQLTGVQLENISGVTDMQNFMTLANMWYQDTTGDKAKSFLKEKYPEVLPFLQGRYYWGPGGPPPDYTDYNTFVDQVRAGLQLPIPPEVAIMQQLVQDNSITREVAITEAYGNDPMKAAAEILWDWNEYKQNVEARYQLQSDFIDMLDEHMFDGKYQDWRTRNAEEWPLLTDHIYSMFSDLSKDIDLATEALSVNFETGSLLDVSNVADDLENAARGIRRVAEQYERTFTGNQSPRERLISQYFTNIYAPFLEKKAEFARRKVAAFASKDDRNLVYTEERVWENTIMQEPVYLYGPDGTQVLAPNPLQYRSLASGPETQQEFITSNVMGNPRWNSLFDNQQLVATHPSLTKFLPTSMAEMRPYDEYDIKRNQIEVAYDYGQITTSQRSEMLDQITEELRAYLQVNGKPGEAQYMLDFTPAERFAEAGMLEQFPFLKNGAANIRLIMDQAEAAGLGTKNSSAVRPAYISMKNEILERMNADPMWAMRLQEFARSIGYEVFDLDIWFEQFMLGKFD